MKVLFSGAWNPRFEALPEYLVEAFEKEGHQVLPFDHRAFRLPGRIRAAAPPLHRADRKLLNRRLLKEARRFVSGPPARQPGQLSGPWNHR